MKAKKAIVALGCAGLLVAGSVAGTLAYLTSTAAVTNTFTVGNVKIKLDEADVNADGTLIEGAERVQANEYHLLPGHTYEKDPTVTVLANSEECYVRMFVTIDKSEEWDDICDKYENVFGVADIFEGEDTNVWLPKGNTENLAEDNTRTYEFWYKGTVVKSDKDTVLTDLFTKITVPEVLDNDDLTSIADSHIYVVAQAIQVDGFNNAEEAFKAAPTIKGSQLMPSDSDNE